MKQIVYALSEVFEWLTNVTFDIYIKLQDIYCEMDSKESK